MPFWYLLPAGPTPFLKPNEEADRHRRSGDAHFAIKNRARIFRTVELEAESAVEETPEPVEAPASRGVQNGRARARATSARRAIRASISRISARFSRRRSRGLNSRNCIAEE